MKISINWDDTFKEKGFCNKCKEVTNHYPLIDTLEKTIDYECSICKEINENV